MIHFPVRNLKKTPSKFVWETQIPEKITFHASVTTLLLAKIIRRHSNISLLISKLSHSQPFSRPSVMICVCSHFSMKKTIRDGGSPALLTVYTVYTVYIVNTIQTAFHCLNSSMYAYIYCEGRLERGWNGLMHV